MAITEITIKNLGPKGDGVGFAARGPVFIDRAAPGDKLKAKVARDDRGVIRGEIVELLMPSEQRQDPPCPHYDRCGNCTLQHVNKNFYRAWKEDLVREAFEKQDLFARKYFPPVYVGENTRRRATFSAVKNRGRVIVGYYQRRSKQISDINACLISDPKILWLKTEVAPYLPALLLENKPVDIFFQLAGKSVDMVVTGEVNRSALDSLKKLQSATRITYRFREGDRFQNIKGGTIEKDFSGLKVSLPPDAFLQPTEEGEKALVQAVLNAAPAKGKFADLFSGCGTFTGALLSRGTVDAYESDPTALEALKKSDHKNKVTVFRRDLFSQPLRREEANRYDAIVLDPPRAGCLEQAHALASSKAKNIIYVSCNPATFARDAKVLTRGKYRIESLRIVDQFVWSHHVELVAHFTK